jgi:uncharacterized membrane protein (DUF2068 family)
VASNRSDRVIRLIGVFKLVKAAALVVVGVGLLELMHRDVAATLESWANTLGVDPNGHHLGHLIARFGALEPRDFEELGIGTLIYAAVFVTEGIGLFLRRVWAEYMTVIVTTSFVPLEVHELVEHGSIAKAIVIAVNLAAVAYLIRRLRIDKHWPFRDAPG